VSHPCKLKPRLFRKPGLFLSLNQTRAGARGSVATTLRYWYLEDFPSSERPHPATLDRGDGMLERMGGSGLD
jgi:hypothetical protein